MNIEGGASSLKKEKSIKIPPQVSKYIELEMENYVESTKMLRQLRADIIHGKASEDLVGRKSKTDKSDPTGAKVVKLNTELVIQRLERMTSAIEYAYNSDERLFYVFVLYYVERKPMQEVCRKLHISNRSFYRYRRALILTVGERTGHIIT